MGKVRILLKDKFNVAILLAFALVASIAILDIFSMNSGVFGSPLDYTTGDFVEGWWNIFRDIVLWAVIFLGIVYYALYRRDKSEAVGISLVAYISWRFGLADVLFFLFQGRPVPETLEWLQGNFPIQFFANILNGGTVTSMVLYVSAISGIIISVVVAKALKKYL